LKRLLSHALDQNEIFKLYEYVKERGQSKVSNIGIAYAVEPYLVEVIYNYDLCNFIYYELCKRSNIIDDIRNLLNKKDKNLNK